MRYLPIQLDVEGREALIIGGGADVLSKIDRLIAAGARVAVVALPPIDPEIEARARDGVIALSRRAFEEGDLTGKAIVFLAPFVTKEEEALARRLHEDAMCDGRLFCAIDRPEASTFINAALVRAHGLTMTFSTEGQSPGTARRIREDLEALFADPRWERYLAALGRLRASLPRGERATRMAEAVKGFAVEARLRFPAWFDTEREP